MHLREDITKATGVFIAVFNGFVIERACSKLKTSLALERVANHWRETRADRVGTKITCIEKREKLEEEKNKIMTTKYQRHSVITAE
jgi:hypothetical protein